MQTPPHVPHSISVLMSLALTGLMLLVGCGLLLAAHQAAKIPKYRSYRRAMSSFACLSLLAGGTTILQMAQPTLAREPYATWISVGCLAPTVAIGIYFLSVARGRYETASLLIVLAPTVLFLIGEVSPKLPAPPPIAELAAAVMAIGTVSVVPYWLVWRRVRRFVTRWPSTFTLKRALWVTAGSGTLDALYWHDRHPADLLSAFIWAGAIFGGMVLLLGVGVILHPLYARGRLQRWLSAEQQVS